MLFFLFLFLYFYFIHVLLLLLQYWGLHTGAFYHWFVSPAFLFYFETVLLCCLGWPRTCDPPPSAFWAAGIADVHNHASLFMQCVFTFWTSSEWNQIHIAGHHNSDQLVPHKWLHGQVVYCSTMKQFFTWSIVLCCERNSIVPESLGRHRSLLLEFSKNTTKHFHLLETF